MCQVIIGFGMIKFQSQPNQNSGMLYSPPLISITLISGKFVYALRKIALPKKPPKNTIVSVDCQLLKYFLKRIAPLYNEFTSISNNLNESEAKKFY